MGPLPWLLSTNKSSSPSCPLETPIVSPPSNPLGHPAGHVEQRTVGTARIALAGMAHDRALKVRTNTVRNAVLTKLGQGGPALSNAMFATGVNHTLRRARTWCGTCSPVPA